MKFKAKLSIAIIALTAACLPLKEENSRFKHLVSKDLSEENVKKALEADYALQINLTTNRLTYYRAGKAVDHWNIASADVTGEYHKIEGKPQKQSTPTGIFTAHDIESCPQWFPSAPFNPKTGKIVENETERAEVFKENPDLFGACGKDNPLGKYALWFSGAYGVHGNSASWILDLPIDDRRVSGGCIRNPNEKIKMVFDEIVNAKLDEYRKEVDENLRLDVKDRKTITAWNIIDKVRVHIIVGNWDRDPVIEGQKTVIKRIEVIEPPAFEKLCTVKFVSPSSGVLEIYRKIPFSQVVGSYKINQKVEILSSEGNIYRTAKGYINGGYLGNCVEQQPTKVWKEVEIPIEEAQKMEEEEKEEKAGPIDDSTEGTIEATPK